MESEKRGNVLIIHTGPSSFVKRDIKLLAKHYNVKAVEFPTPKASWTSPFRLLKFIFKGVKYVKWSDILIPWFSDVHAFWAMIFSRIFNKKVVIIVGGYDVACEPEINYGMCQENMLRQFLSKLALNNADLLIPVSYNTKRECLNWLTHGVPCIVIYHGAEIPEKSKVDRSKKVNTSPMVLTVGAVKFSNLKRKGIEIFVKASNFLRNVKFVVVGEIMDKSIDYLKNIGGTNVIFTGFISDKELEEYYWKSRVYVQPSWHEGFGCSVAEAMLRECIPVVSRRGALSEVVGNTGIYADHGNPEAVAKAIQIALENPKLGRKARIRIIRMFNMQKRELRLKRAIERVISR